MGSNQKGFTLIELVMVIVILGILAAVAIPRFINLSDQAEAAAEEGIVGALRSSVYVYSVNQMATTGSATYPSNPFSELKVPPNTYISTTETPPANDRWTFASSVPEIRHQRKDGTQYEWSYNSSTGVIGERAAGSF